MTNVEFPTEMIVFEPTGVAAPHHLYLFPEGEKSPVVVCIRFSNEGFFKGIAKGKWQQDPEAFVEMQEDALRGVAQQYASIKSSIVKKDFQGNKKFREFLASVGCLLEMSAVRGGGACHPDEGHHVLVTVGQAPKNTCPPVQIKSAIVDAVEPLDLLSIHQWLQSDLKDGPSTKRLIGAQVEPPSTEDALLDFVEAHETSGKMPILCSCEPADTSCHVYIYPMGDETPTPICLSYDYSSFSGPTFTHQKALADRRNEVITEVANIYWEISGSPSGPLVFDGANDHKYRRLLATAAVLMDLSLSDGIRLSPGNSLHILIGVETCGQGDQATVICKHDLLPNTAPLDPEYLRQWLLDANDDGDDGDDGEDLSEEELVAIAVNLAVVPWPDHVGLYVVDTAKRDALFEITPAQLDAADGSRVRMTLTNAITSFNTLADICLAEPALKNTMQADIHQAAITIMRHASLTSKFPIGDNGHFILDGHKRHLVIDIAGLKSQEDFSDDRWLYHVDTKRKMTLKSVLKYMLR